jgi:LacI family transcriptional regulator
MSKGFFEECAQLGVQARLIDEVTSDTGAMRVEKVAKQIFGAADWPDGVVIGSATASMALVTGGESHGLVLGRDFDVGTKDSVRFLRRFRSDMLVVHEDVGHAGDFLARAVMASIDRRGPQTATQFLDIPAQISGPVTGA